MFLFDLFFFLYPYLFANLKKQQFLDKDMKRVKKEFLIQIVLILDYLSAF